jgi:hypothetical protein
MKIYLNGELISLDIFLKTNLSTVAGINLLSRMDNFPSVVSTNDLFRLTIASAIFLATFSALIIFSSLRGVSFCCDPSLVNALKPM